ncbi:hypothetical protein H8R18_00685 [Nanchangia anserum]|uniref:Uncharacterized protein n=1 Tax=Nanchangia anserum TaxID=2692125 RepID=A0A8I0G8C0_9ACTO|nr:hypothetical protein [Nanchangia anserum]MBD3689760.1 hypothetical protein [Nanchangia anserum]QOX81931.1 hypothetical protein H8R18_00685 [Nanchangia anserum]
MNTAAHETVDRLAAYYDDLIAYFAHHDLAPGNYLDDAALDIVYRIGTRGEYRGAEITLTPTAPTIRLNTHTRQLTSPRHARPVPAPIVQALDDALQGRLPQVAHH